MTRITRLLKVTSVWLCAVSIIFTAASRANAQMMGNSQDGARVDWNKVGQHTLQGEEKGKAIWEKLQSKQLECGNLSDEDFDALGEHFMGQMMGSAHAAMNAMMIQARGEDGEEQIHVVMGKRLSGCDTSAALPLQGFGWMPMMQMMSGGWSSPFGFNPGNIMMDSGYGFGFFGWIFMVLWWALIIAALVALIRWLMGWRRSGNVRSPLDILKERHAKGEIDRKEFEDGRKDLLV